MSITLDSLIREHREWLLDEVTKDAIRQIPSYGMAALRQTLHRVERWLDVLVESIDRNEPDVLEAYLVGVAGERMSEGYVIGELHAIIQITERHIQELIRQATTDEIERNALLALLDAVMGAARMVLSARYALSAARKKVTP